MINRSIGLPFPVFSILLLIGFSLQSTPAIAEEDGDARTPTFGIAATAATGPRTSEYDPPEEDTFVTDSGPGLDTGCTFDDDPEHPLIIDVYIDRAVGSVDANGYLVNPDELIANGVIPSVIEIAMPAYDVDVNGAPIPERDEVSFNGENIGLLTGDNNVWKLNSFFVDIRKVKFPAPPAPGSALVIPANRLQITVDTLADGLWCTAIDWVAIKLPIIPTIALTLEPIGGNEIKVNDLNSTDTIDIIYQQTLDADCNVTEVIGPIDDYPFSGSSESGLFGLFSGEAKVRTKIASCPAGSLPSSPEVEVTWNIGGTSLRGTDTWAGTEGVTTVTMPNVVGSYDVNFEYKVDGVELTTITRKLFVTKSAPLGIVDPPRLSWYELATSWATGLSDEGDILSSLLGGLYQYGQKYWDYKDDPNTCGWKGLAAEPDPLTLTLTCNYGNCYTFSHVFDNMAATLGIGGLQRVKTKGTGDRPFITNANPSLDPGFPGSAKPFASGLFDHDRYWFSSHSLRRKGILSPIYYDATFNGRYLSDDAFIAWNLDGTIRTDPVEGPYFSTHEGAQIYRLNGFSYYTWRNYEYKTPPTVTSASSAAVLAPLQMSTDVRITDTASFTTVDANGDGVYDSLTARVDVELLTAGFYTVTGVLKKNGAIVSNQPAYEHEQSTQVEIGDQPGTHTATLVFSGEEIFRSGEDGPYELDIVAIGSTFDQMTIPTPVYDHTKFGEWGGRISSVTDTPSDTDADGRYDFIDIAVDVTVATPGNYVIQGTLLKNSESLVSASDFVTLVEGSQTLSLKFNGVTIFRSGEDGPYEAVIELLNTDAERQDDTAFLTQSYVHTDFEGLLDLTGSFNDQGLDTNGNGLYDLLRVDFSADVRATGTFLVTAGLRNLIDPLTVYSDMLMSLSPGPQNISVTFSGPEINGQGIDGPYAVEVSLRDPITYEVLDVVTLGQQTNTYSHMDFDPLGSLSTLPIIIGSSSDEGIDTNGNGLYDQLLVNVEVELDNSDFYTWSARLADSRGTEIGFYSSNAFLNAGTETIDFIFEGNSIGLNGIDGPYFVKGLLIFGRGGANLVAFDVAETSAYTAREFEGFVGNLTPVAQCRDVTVPADTQCLGVATVDNGSYDPDGDPITLSQSPAGPYELGDTAITLTVTDNSGALDSCTATVTVMDTTAPRLIPPSQASAQCESPTGATVDVGVPTVSDACDSSPTIANDASAVFPLGATTVTWSATDFSGNVATATQEVTIVDTTSPALSLTVAPEVLWPANHKLVPIEPTVTSTDVCDAAPAINLLSVVANEGDNELGDGNTSNDIVISEGGAISLRAERSGKGVGRVYTITYDATDASGNAGTASATVTVPHSQKK